MTYTRNNLNFSNWIFIYL